MNDEILLPAKEDGFSSPAANIPRQLDLLQANWHSSAPVRPAPAASEGFLTALEDFWLVIRRFKWVILCILVVVMAVGTARTLLATRLYTATTRLEINSSISRVVQKGDVAPVEGRDFEFLRTQYELLQSRNIAERTVSSLKLADDADLTRPKDESLFSRLTNLFGRAAPASNVADRAATERGLAAMVVASRVVKPIPGSRLVDISYTDSNPVRAQQIVMGMANEFIASSRDKRFQANAYAKSFLEDQLAQLKLRLQDSEATLIDFGQKEQIVGATDKSSIADSNLAAANVALGNLVSERIRNEQQYRQVDNVTAASLPQFLTNKVIEGLRDKRNTLFTEYQEKGQTLRADYPSMVQINNKIKETDRQIAEEIRVIKASLKGAYEGSLKQEAEMKTRIVSLRAEVLDLQKRSIQFNILKREADSNRTLYEDLLQRYKEVDVAGGIGTSNIFIVDRAEVPGGPSSPNVPANMALFFVFGLVIALAVAFLLERLDNTVTKLDQFERLTGVAMLGAVPRAAPGTTLDEEMKDPRSRMWEAYRTLCTFLKFATDNGLPKSVFFTSAHPSEGKSTSSLAVARHFSSLGLRVLLIDGDLRKPSLHKKLELPNTHGLTNYLTGAASPAKSLQTTAFENLFFMSSGPVPPNPSELLGSPRLSMLMAMATEQFDLVVVDGPPVMGLADAHLLSKATDATVFATHAGKTPKHAIRGALKRLQSGRCNVIGAILTHYQPRNESQSYEYGYSYGSGPEQENAARPKVGRTGLLAGMKALMAR